MNTIDAQIKQPQTNFTARYVKLKAPILPAKPPIKSDNNLSLAIELLMNAEQCTHKASKSKNFIKKWLYEKLAKGFKRQADKLINQ